MKKFVVIRERNVYGYAPNLAARKDARVIVAENIEKAREQVKNGYGAEMGGFEEVTLPPTPKPPVYPATQQPEFLQPAEPEQPEQPDEEDATVIQVRGVPDRGEMTQMTREQLNDLAAGRGIEGAAELRTKMDVIEAIEATVPE